MIYTWVEMFFARVEMFFTWVESVLHGRGWNVLHPGGTFYSRVEMFFHPCWNGLHPGL
jgi:hypothetical protein